MAEEIKYKSCVTCKNFSECPIPEETPEFIRSISSRGFFPGTPSENIKPEERLTVLIHDLLGKECWTWE